jgi:hypothetical protein
MSSPSRLAKEARRAAEGAMGQAKQKEPAYLVERKRVQAANDEKTARLKALRIAKEARDREFAAANPEPAKPKKSRAKKATAPSSTNVREGAGQT